MNNFLNELKRNSDFTLTANGGGAYSSTGNRCLDAFGSLGAMKNASADEIISKFYYAFMEDQNLAMRMLFYNRDVRGGQGIRRTFRVIVHALANSYPELVINNLDNFLFFGRGDDLMSLIGTACEDAMVKYVKSTLEEDLAFVKNGGSCSLLAKWMPSINSSSDDTRKLALFFVEKLGWNKAEYRKNLSLLRANIGIVESKMSANDWEDIEFDKLPSKAAMIYADAFMKHVSGKYMGYLIDLANGDANVNAGALFPYDVVHRARTTKSLAQKYLYDAMWQSLPNYFEGKEETGICVVDVSGSMTVNNSLPLEVALSLGLYCADKCVGPYKGHFITFSARPELVEIKGDSLVDKLHYMERADWGMNTNIEAVFDLILNTAIKNNTPKEEIPSKLYIISDMQFDFATSAGWDRNAFNATVMETIEDKFKAHGYDMPAIVYWNVNSTQCGMFQKRYGDSNCCMVSGYSSSLFESVINGTEYVEETEEVVNDKGEVEVKTVVKQIIDPMTVMNKTLLSERYDRVYTGK